MRNPPHSPHGVLYILSYDCAVYTVIVCLSVCLSEGVPNAAGVSENRRLSANNLLYQYFINSIRWTLCLPVLWHCWLGVQKSIRPVKIEWWGVDEVICLEQGADCLYYRHCIPKPHHLLPHLSLDWFYLSGVGLPRLSWKRGRVCDVCFYGCLLRILKTRNCSSVTNWSLHTTSIFWQQFDCILIMHF